MNNKEQVLVRHSHNLQINIGICRMQTQENQIFISEMMSNSSTVNRFQCCNQNQKRQLNLYFWYSREEPEHVKMIISSYKQFLQLEKDRAKNSRCPIVTIRKKCN